MAVSAFGAAVVGAASNYITVVNAVPGIALALVGGVAAGFGNLTVTVARQRFRAVFSEMNLVGSWLFG